MEEEITLVTSSDSRFLSGAAVVYASSLAHLSPRHTLRAILLACDIDDQRLAEFTEALAPLAGPRFQLRIISLSRERFAGMTTARPDLSVASYGRLYIPELLEGVRKALYLDCDIIVTRDLGELWTIPSAGHPLMAATAPGDAFHDNLRKSFALMDHDNFCSGTLVMDLEQIRASGAHKACLDLASNSEHHFPQSDQDILNIVFAHSTKYLDPCWGTLCFLEPDKPNVVPDQSVLIHTILGGKPWYYSRKAARGIIGLFYQYLDMTDWEQYRDDEVRFHHTCSAPRYLYTLFRMRLRHYAQPRWPRLK
jgi:lipopolysaccharide biosynthesis glycosyltransferase